MRKLTVLALVALGVLLSCVSLAAAAPPSSAPASIQLMADPFLASGEVTTAVPMVPRCPCHVNSGCAYQPIGINCADEPNCCSCRGVDPAMRKCVGVPPSAVN